MDEYHCCAYPNNPASADEFVSENPFHPYDQYFNVEIKHTDMYVLSANMFHTFNHSTYHSFQNIAKDKMMQETTIVGWLSTCIGVPKDAHKLLVAKITDCARDMANRTHRDKRVLFMRVEVVITHASEDDDDDDGGGDRFEEEAEEEEPMEEEEEDGDEHHGLEPAAKSSIERLEIVKVEEEEPVCVQGRCAICFEDLIVGVRMPCLHLFHRNCIVHWLQIGHSCPLCRFQLPTNTSE